MCSFDRILDLPDKDKYGPLYWKAVALAVLDTEVSPNQTSSFDQLSHAMNNWSGINEESETHAIVDNNLLVSAFYRGADAKEIFSYEDLGIGLE